MKMTKDIEMALIKNKADAKTPGAPPKGTTLGGNTKLEPDPGAAAAAAAPAPAAAAPAAAPAEPAAATSTQTAVAIAAPKGAVTTMKNIKDMDVIGQCENAYKVDWNTLERVQANQGNFLDIAKAKASMGAEIQMQMLSWQKSWQVSPGSDDPAAKEFVRYSDDGKVTKLGEVIEDYLDELRTKGYPKAKCDERCTLVGVLMGAEKDSRLEGELFQIDLSSTSRQSFDRYRISTAFKIGQGLLTPEAAQLITMKAELTTFKSNTWTVVHFEPTTFAPAAA